MHPAATAAGVTLLPLSGFRSVARQTEIICGKFAAGLTLPIILTRITALGYSEHHTGRALDLNILGETALDESFARTAAYDWLCTHAAEYGFRLSSPRDNRYGLVYEPWHWCWLM